MKVELLALSYGELKSRRDALNEMIGEPFKDIACTIIIHDARIPALMELDEALAILTRARELKGRAGEKL